MSDHLPIFGNANNTLPRSYFNSSNEYRRTFSHTKQTQFRDLLLKNLNSYNCYVNDSNPNASLERLIKLIQMTYNDTFPMRKISKRSQKKYRKPWVTTSILKEIKHKHKLFKIFLGKRDNTSHLNFKWQRNLVKRSIDRAKRDYHKRIFEQSKSNSKKTWKNLNDVLNRKKKNLTTVPDSIIFSDKEAYNTGRSCKYG